MITYLIFFQCTNWVKSCIALMPAIEHTRLVILFIIIISHFVEERVSQNSAVVSLSIAPVPTIVLPVRDACKLKRCYPK